MRVAAIDIGTNSVLLLVAEQTGGDLVALVERAVITRLGQGVDASRELAPEAVDRTLACLGDYARQIRALGVDRLDAVGTSAMRDARGGEALVARARELLGVAPRVISGGEEAELTFEGALSGLSIPMGPVTVLDIGGGSTEIIAGDPAASRVTSAMSLDVGSVRLTERHVRSDPPRGDELESVRADVRADLVRVPSSPRGATLVGVAGTVTTLAAILREVSPYDAKRIHGARIPRDDLARLLSRLASMPLAERRQLVGLDPARADVIVSGAVVADEVMRWSAAGEMIVSDRGVRWGLALRLATGEPPAGGGQPNLHFS